MLHTISPLIMISAPSCRCSHTSLLAALPRRYKLLLQPLRHALLYDSNEAVRVAALDAWAGVVAALGRDYPPTGQPHAGAGADGSFLSAKQARR